MGAKDNGDGIGYLRWLADQKELTRREAERDTRADYVESVRDCLAQCPDFIEMTMLRLHFLLRRNPNSEDLRMAHQYLEYALKDMVKAREWASKL